MSKVKIIMIIFVPTLLFFLPFLFYYNTFQLTLIKLDSSWANFGSFVGGVGATIFSFLSFAAVLFSYNHEKHIRKESERELQRQKEEDRFFKYLELINNCRASLSVKFEAGIFIGNDALNKYVDYFDFIYERYSDLVSGDNNTINPKLNTDIEKLNYLKRSTMHATSLYLKLLEFVKSSKFNQEESFSIFISQLTYSEKLFISFSCFDWLVTNNLVSLFIESDDLEASKKKCYKIKELEELVDKKCKQ